MCKTTIYEASSLSHKKHTKPSFVIADAGNYVRLEADRRKMEKCCSSAIFFLFFFFFLKLVIMKYLGYLLNSFGTLPEYDSILQLAHQLITLHCFQKLEAGLETQIEFKMGYDSWNFLLWLTKCCWEKFGSLWNSMAGMSWNVGKESSWSRCEVKRSKDLIAFLVLANWSCKLCLIWALLDST